MGNVALVGRPNVGKSLLFNRLLGRKRALVHGSPNLTLDFLAEPLALPAGGGAMLYDTGGVFGESDEWTTQAQAQTDAACSVADAFVAVVCAKSGRLAADEELLRALRRKWQKPWLLAVNKAEGLAAEAATADFLSLGAPNLLAVSAKTGDGLGDLRQAIANMLPAAAAPAEAAAKSAPVIAIVGRPNVGKSTVVNRMLRQKRMAVSNRPGSTRDSVFALLPAGKDKGGKGEAGDFWLVDTAGQARKRAEDDRKRLAEAGARAAVGRANVALLVVDLADGITRQDKRVAALANKNGAPVLLLANKADLLPNAAAVRAALAQCKKEVSAVAAFAVSALRQPRFPSRQLLAAARAATAAGGRRYSTAQLNQTLAKILLHRAPKPAGGARPKLRYAHQGGVSPLRIVVHGSATRRVDAAYIRYLQKSFARELNLQGAPVKVELRAGANPYHDS